MPQPGSGASARSRFHPYQAALRGGALALVFLAGFIGLSSGVEVTERELGELGYWAKAYYALGLFVVGGVDLGTPHGGPTAGRALLWSAYFLAPTLTASALVEATLRLLNPRARRLRRLQGHVIVGGAGRLSLLYIKKLRELDPHVPLVVIERDPNRASLGELEHAYNATVIIGDISSDEVLQSVGIAHARRVMLLTGDDFGNLDAASRILKRMPWQRGNIIAHVADLGFLRAVPAETIDAGFTTFNGLEFAAIHLVEQRLIARFETTEHRDLVVLAGFGRFGQTVLHQLQDKASEVFGAVILLDLEAEANALKFAESPGFGDYPRHVIQGHVRHLAIWQQIDEIIAGDIGEPVIVVGTGDEGTNLHTALDLRRRYPNAHITVRSFGHSPFAKGVAAKTGLQPFELAELISSSMPRAWFE
ncbi:voltage-gated potassium channel [Enhygromyxa salina]|uniref:Voltage-gated potassium channel n=1 Tax=Enhygromyxa salina TaxID=215803 RepID=A0A2S9XJS0_9BACT|nr:NAD-binding protein [Enhygromyxa salina]PRP93114.1 voltage-gated potassium channel [Enhygromyxa salina]